MGREVIFTDQAPKPSPYYPQATKCKTLLYTAGQLPLDSETGKVVANTIEEQTRQALENLKAVPHAAGYSLDDILKVNIYFKRASDFDGMNNVYVSYFKEKPPARTTVKAEMIDPNLLIEFDAVACK